MSLILRGEIWHYDFICDGKRYQGSTGFAKKERQKATAAEAKRKVEIREQHSIELIWEQTKRKMVGSHNVEAKFDTVWDVFSEKTLSTAGIRRMKLYASHINTFLSWLNALHPVVTHMGQVTEEHAKEYLAKVRKAPGAIATKNDKLNTLRMVFDVLGKNAGVIENPFRAEGIKKQTLQQINREIYTPEEQELIGQKATEKSCTDPKRKWIYSLFITLISTGQREGDCALIKKTYFDLSSYPGWIHFPKISKTGRPLDLPLLSSFRAHVEARLAEDNPSEYVFPELAEKYKKDSASIGKEIKEFFAEIGIVGTLKDVDGYARKVSVKDAHSFRHTFTVEAAEAGWPFPIVQEAVGHRSAKMTQLYMDHVNKAKKEKYFSQFPERMKIKQKQQTKTLEEKVSPESILQLLNQLTPDNVEENKKRLMALLQARELLQPSGLSR